MTSRERLIYRNQVKQEARRMVIRMMKFDRKMQMIAMEAQRKEFERLQAQGKIVSPLGAPNMIPPGMPLPPGAQVRAVPIQVTPEQLQAILAAQNTQQSESGIIIPR